MIRYVNKTKWKKMKKEFMKENETYRYDPIEDTVIVTRYYRRDRLNPVSPPKKEDMR